jgi:hypothetical protein
MTHKKPALDSIRDGGRFSGNVWGHQNHYIRNCFNPKQLRLRSDRLERDGFKLNHNLFSENRYPLFRIML